MLLSSKKVTFSQESILRSKHAGRFLAGLVGLTLCATKAFALSVDVAYTAPTVDINNQPLTGLAGCEVSIGNKTGVYTRKILSPTCQTVSVPDLDPSLTYYFSVVAKSIDGTLSGPSAEVAFSAKAETAPGDFDGDGITDLAFLSFKAQKQTASKASNRSKKIKKAVFQGIGSADEHLFEFTLGEAGSMPGQADYDGDGITDFAVVSPGAVSSWSVQLSASSKVVTKKFGRTDETMIAGCDFDGDHQADMASLKGRTFISKGFLSGRARRIVIPIKNAFKVVNCSDLDGDGKSELVVTSAQGSRDWLIAFDSQGKQVFRKLIDRSGAIVSADVNGDSTNELGYLARKPSGKSSLNFLISGQETPVSIEVDRAKSLTEARFSASSLSNDGLFLHSQTNRLQQLSLLDLTLTDRNASTANRILLKRVNVGLVKSSAIKTK